MSASAELASARLARKTRIFIRNSELEQKGNDFTILFSWVAGCLVPCHENGRTNRDGQDRDNDHERDVIRDRKEPGQGHFDSNKNENDGEADPEINKPIHQIGQQEVKGTQAENCANVRRINDERVLGDGEDGRKIGRASCRERV